MQATPSMPLRPLSEWPLGHRAAIGGVFTDIDDTLTTDGDITADALSALHRLRAAGRAVVAITGRPVGWAQAKAQAWPVDAMVVENGAVALVPMPAAGTSVLSPFSPERASDGHKMLQKIYQQDAGTRMRNSERMRVVAQRVRERVPGVALSADSNGRETDLAFDYHEHARLPPDTVEAVLAVLRSEGMYTTVSSIHIHGCFGDFDKWRGACWIVRELWQRDLATELGRWVFVGDSGNDQAMFEHFKHSVGVANVARFVGSMTHLPRYVTAAERGAGFAEVAAAILDAT